MEFSRVNLNTVRVKAKSNLEIYRIIVTEGKIYLTSMNEYGLDFISEFFIGKKKDIFQC